MKISTWNVRSLNRAGPLKAAARQLARYKLDVVGVQEVRWDEGRTVRAGDFYGKGNDNHQLGTGFFCTPYNGISSEESRVSDRLSYIVLRGRWLNIIFVNVHASSEEKSYE